MSLPATLERATALFRDGRRQEAHDVLAPALKMFRPTPDALQLMGLIRHSLGDAEGSERELRAAVALAPAAEIYSHTLARMLTSQGRFDDAAEVHAALARAAPAHPAADFWRAQSLLSAEREAEAEQACRLAIAKGLDRADPWLFLARVYMGQGRFAAAEQAYREAVKRETLNPGAQRELAQLIWMQTADAAKASSVIDTTPNGASLLPIKVKLLQDAGEHAQAYALAAARAAKDPAYGLLAARAALRVEPDQALGHLARTAPGSADEMTLLKVEVEASLAVGDLDRAGKAAERLRDRYPADQYGLTLQSSVWRLQGDPRYAELYDYGRLVKAYRIEPPEGWSSLETYLADLEAGLDALHGLKTHPIGQSVRHGSQTHQALLKAKHPAIKAFFQAIDAPIRRHIEAIGEGGQDYRVVGAWSVRLNREGFHTNHSHPEGWLSSAFYVRLPSAIDEGRQGWIKFGEPGTPTRRALEPEHFVRPEPGLLVLFPSYMWHGTVPFESDGTRLTAAFDLARAP